MFGKNFRGTRSFPDSDSSQTKYSFSKFFNCRISVFFGRGRCPGVGVPDQQPSEGDRDNPIPSELGSPEKFFRPPAVRNLRIEPLQLGRDDDDDAAHNERTKPGVEI